MILGFLNVVDNLRKRHGPTTLVDIGKRRNRKRKDRRIAPFLKRDSRDLRKHNGPLRKRAILRSPYPSTALPDSSASSRSQAAAASTSAASACHVQLPSATPGTFMRASLPRSSTSCSGMITTSFSTPAVRRSMSRASSTAFSARHSPRQRYDARCHAQARRPSRHRRPQSCEHTSPQGSQCRACPYRPQNPCWA